MEHESEELEDAPATFAEVQALRKRVLQCETNDDEIFKALAEIQSVLIQIGRVMKVRMGGPSTPGGIILPS